MNRAKINDWFRDKDIFLKENFINTFENYIDSYIKKSMLNRDDIHALLGTNQQYISRMRNNQGSTLTKNYLKHRIIMRAGKLFELSYAETEGLANKAGLSLEFLKSKTKDFSANMANQTLEFSIELSPYGVSTNLAGQLNEAPFTEIPNFKDFIECFNSTVSAHEGKISDLCEAAMVSERMFRYMKKGEHLKKESILAVLISMKCPAQYIIRCLNKAGFTLSESIIFDSVVLWSLENRNSNTKKTNLVYDINETLDSLGLPLLMTRPKKES